MTIGRVLRGLILSAGVAIALLAALPAGAAPPSAIKQVGLERTGPSTFSIDVDGADIRTVCRAIGEFAGRNVLVSKDVKATVTIALKDVEWQQALRSVLRSCGLDYVDEGGILRVDDAAKLRAEAVARETARNNQLEVAPLETRIIKLNFANASEIQSALTAGLTRRGTILVEKRTNSLIVTDLTANVDKVEQMAISLDSTTPQVEITAKLVDVDAESLREMGIEWNVGPTPDGPAFIDPQPNDGPWGSQNDVNPGNTGDNVLRGSQKSGISDPATTITYGVAKSWGFVESQLQLLEQNRKANIISNPRITTVDNREAKIVVGQKIPLIVSDVAGNPVSQLQTIGIQLKVTPHVTEDKKIIMDLHPEVSDLSTQSTVQGGVIINTSEADTRVMVDDGQTAVIGGLIRSNESTVRRGVPVLKDLPLLGALFRSDSNVRQNRELIIFVTPRLVTSMASN